MLWQASAFWPAATSSRFGFRPHQDIIEVDRKAIGFSIQAVAPPNTAQRTTFTFIRKRKSS